jgi:hypothetical protein
MMRLILRRSMPRSRAIARRPSLAVCQARTVGWFLRAAGWLAGKACLMARAGRVVLAATGGKYAVARGNHGQRSPAVRHSGPPGGGGGY